MKATAKIITGSVRALASPVGLLVTCAYGLPAGVAANAELTNKSGSMVFLHVLPEEPQEMVWLHPDGIDYHIETSTNLHWQVK
jgi:hypothetical protein